METFKIFASRHEVKKIIVLDNLEQIFGSKKLMAELANIIILLDDQRYAKCNVNFLIVGVPSGVLDYFAETKNLESVGNRIEELEKVGSLTKKQTRQIIAVGFEQLAVRLTEADLEIISNHTFDVTLGIAQKVHEYCEELAYQVEANNWLFNSTMLSKADLKWLKQGLRKCYSVIEHHLNSRDTTVARRNQVIYAIGKVKRHQFDSNAIDILVREYFPDTIPSTNMGIGSILNELASQDSPLLKRNIKMNEYSVLDPRSIMCIRVMLYVDGSTNKVMKRGFVQ